MKIYEVKPDGSFEDRSTLPKLRNILAAIDEQELRLQFTTSWKTVFENDPDTGALVVSVVVPAGSHPDWDNGVIVTTALRSACQKIGEVFGEMMGADTGFDISKTRVRVVNSGGGTNVPKTDVIEFFNAVKTGEMAQKARGPQPPPLVDDFSPSKSRPGQTTAPVADLTPTQGQPAPAEPSPGQAAPAPRTSTPERTQTN